LRLERIDQLKAWYTADQAEQHFNAVFPTEKDIEAYLSNVTILLSDGAFHQAVYYFDEPNRFLQWSNDGTPNTALVRGEWFTKWYFQPMELNGRWRVALVYSFCKWLPSRCRDTQLPQDGCKIVENLNLLFNAANAVREYKAGNIFKLSAGETPPFPLPNHTRISIDGLLAMGKAQRRP
jgi:hypothetical protein